MHSTCMRFYARAGLFAQEAARSSMHGMHVSMRSMFVSACGICVHVHVCMFVCAYVCMCVCVCV
jgi:hypothetical protein